MRGSSMLFRRGARALVAVVLLGLLLAACGEAAGDAPPGGIVFVSDRDGNEEIYRIQPDGSGLLRLTDHPAMDRDPYWSPDGRQVAFRSRRDGSSDIFVMGADGGEPTNLIGDPVNSSDDEFEPTWHPDGAVLALYTDRQGEGCPGHRLALMPACGGAEAIQLAPVPPGNQVSLDWSPDGYRLVYSSVWCGREDTHLFVWDQQTGETTQLTSGRMYPALYPAWSHDGRTIAFAGSWSGNSEIYVLDLETMALTNLTNDPSYDTRPAWSPDDRRIAFSTNRDGNAEIYTMAADGSDLRNITRHPGQDLAPHWAPVR